MVKTWSTPVIVQNGTMVPCAICGALCGALCGAGRFAPALDCEGFSYVRCASCGLVQINPQPVRAGVLARYGETFGKDYLSYELENEAAFLKLQQLALEDAKFGELEKTLFSAAATATATAAARAEADAEADADGGPPGVLDIGCATGALLSLLRGRGWRVTGVEISPAAEYARNERGLDVRNLPLEENKFPDAGFDVVHASHLIEHLNDPRSFLNEIHRILKKDGRVFITTPNISGFQARITGSSWRSAIFDHLYLFSARTLTELLKSTGFTVEGVFTWGGLAHGLVPGYVPIFAVSRLKKIADFLAKRLGCGDVMMVRAKAG
ncbi:MAG: class I SAM-dependent methyltransferase [Treponema sp.]|jgi:SAM-dependent methyltransferase|nr:class I SAM-dependent methyltransferase [Treponema sp.]